MRLILLLLVGCLYSCTPCWADDGHGGGVHMDRDLTWAWTPAEVGLQALSMALVWVDYSQTQWLIRQDPNKWEERNQFILGAHPDNARVNQFFIGKVAVQLLGAVAIPHDYRKWWQGFWIVTDGRVAYDNWQVGMQMHY